MKYSPVHVHIGQFRIRALRFGVDNWTARVYDEDIQDTLIFGRLLWEERNLRSSVEAVRAGEAWVNKQVLIAAWRRRAHIRRAVLSF